MYHFLPTFASQIQQLNNTSNRVTSKETERRLRSFIGGYRNCVACYSVADQRNLGHCVFVLKATNAWDASLRGECKEKGFREIRKRRIEYFNGFAGDHNCGQRPPRSGAMNPWRRRTCSNNTRPQTQADMLLLVLDAIDTLTPVAL